MVENHNVSGRPLTPWWSATDHRGCMTECIWRPSGIEVRLGHWHYCGPQSTYNGVWRMTFKGHWEQNLGSVNIPLDVHCSLLKRLSSGETIVLLNKLQWEYYFGSVKIHLDLHRSLLKGLSSGETIVLYCLWLGGDRSSPWLNELHTEFVYVLFLSSSNLGFTTANF